MGNEESHSARKDSQTTPTNNQSPSNNQTQDMSNYQQPNHQPPNQGGWVPPPQNANSLNQGKMYPVLPQQPFSTVNPIQAKPQQPSAPPQQTQQPNAPTYFPQPPTGQTFYPQPPVESKTQISTNIPIQSLPFKVHPMSNDIWSEGRPSNAFRAGHDSDGSVLYVGRAIHNQDLLPGKVVPTHGCAYVCYGGREFPTHAYETLIGDQYHWVPASYGQVPPGAVEGGFTVNGEKLFIGRAAFKNSLTPGKLHPSHKCLYVPYGGEELRFEQYEVLVHKSF